MLHVFVILNIWKPHFYKSKERQEELILVIYTLTQYTPNIIDSTPNKYKNYSYDVYIIILFFLHSKSLKFSMYFELDLLHFHHSVVTWG